jgi:hypothetical protein
MAKVESFKAVLKTIVFGTRTGLHRGAPLVCLRVHRDVIRIDFREGQFAELPVIGLLGNSRMPMMMESTLIQEASITITIIQT